MSEKKLNFSNNELRLVMKYSFLKRWLDKESFVKVKELTKQCLQDLKALCAKVSWQGSCFSFLVQKWDNSVRKGNVYLPFTYFVYCSENQITWMNCEKTTQKTANSALYFESQFSIIRLLFILKDQKSFERLKIFDKQRRVCAVEEWFADQEKGFYPNVFQRFC